MFKKIKAFFKMVCYKIKCAFVKAFVFVKSIFKKKK